MQDLTCYQPRLQLNLKQFSAVFICIIYSLWRHTDMIDGLLNTYQLILPFKPLTFSAVMY